MGAFPYWKSMSRMQGSVLNSIVSTLVCFLLIGSASASPDSSTSPEKHSDEHHQHEEHHLHNESDRLQKRNVSEWFKKYDQIRRDAEMSMGDRFQVMLMATGMPEKRSITIAARMIDKYKIALVAMKSLKYIEETKELQDGYIKYFDSALHVLRHYVEERKDPHFKAQPFFEVEKELQDLDKSNKTLDEHLRKEHSIPKHKHS